MDEERLSIACQLGRVILDDLRITCSRQALNHWCLPSMSPGDVVGREEKQSKAHDRLSVGGEGKTQKMRRIEESDPPSTKVVAEQFVHSREEEEEEGGSKRKSDL